MNFLFLMMAGSGSRIKNINCKKQFYIDSVYKKPLFYYSLNTAIKTNIFDKIILICNQNDCDTVNNFLKENINLKHNDDLIKVVSGGNSRAESVNLGLKYLKKNYSFNDNDILVIHDSCRPFVSKKQFSDIIKFINNKLSATFAINLVDTIVQIYPSLKEANRSSFLRVQTPQAFKLTKIYDIYSHLTTFTNTDEMQLIYKETNLYPYLLGNSFLRKVTYDEDIDIYEAMLKSLNFDNI